MVEELELKCYEYINSIRDIEKFSRKGIYNLDKIRTEIHNELCQLSGLPKEIMKGHTDNLDPDDMNGTDLYLFLLEMMK